MLHELLVGTLYNTAILLALSLLFDIAYDRDLLRGTPGRKVLLGAGLGVLTVATMAAAVEVQPGVVFDTRAVVLSLIGLFFGAWAALSAAAVALGYRLSVGGPGALTGALVIVAAVVLGLLWRRSRAEHLHALRARDLFVFGVVVSLVELALFFTLPAEIARALLPILAPVNLLTHPAATVAVGLLLVRKLRHEKAAERLREAETRYRTLFESSPSVMLLIDPDTFEIVDANRAAEAYYGYDLARLRTMHIQDINTLSADGIAREVGALRVGTRRRFRFRHRRADGSEREVEVFAGFVHIDGRELLNSIVLDVTERVEAEGAVRARDEALRLQAAALEAAGNPIMITDAEGHIEWVNPAFTDVTGYGRDEAIGHTATELVGSGTHSEEFYDDLWTTIRAGRVWHGLMTNRRKDGSTYQEEQTITPVLDKAGAISHFVAVKRDVSERLEMEARLRASQKMETVGQLAGGVAHDFNNLLTVILGTAELVLESLPQGDSLHGEVSEIRDTARRAATLTRQLLAFSRRQIVQVREVDLNQVIDELSGMLRRLIGEHVDLVFRLADRPLPVEADVGQLQQVLINLVVNARDAMPEGGRLTVETGERADPPAMGRLSAEVRAARSGAGRWTWISVQDTGTGISPEVAEKMFEPFFTTKREGEGTGLGLATVYGIVEQAGGDLEVASEVGVGTTFTVFLPSAGAGQAPRRGGARGDAAGESAASDGTVRAVVLLVEDDPAIQRVAERVLLREGHEVRVASTAEEALALLERLDEPVDLMLTDVLMPGMNGPELARRARALRPSIRIVLSSGYAGQDLAAEGTLDEDFDFLPKPYTIEALSTAVQVALARR